MAKPHSDNREGNPNWSQIPLLTHATSKNNLEEDPYQLQNEIMKRTNMTNLEERPF